MNNAILYNNTNVARGLDNDALRRPFVDLLSNLFRGDVVWPRYAIVCGYFDTVLAAERTEVRTRCK